MQLWMWMVFVNVQFNYIAVVCSSYCLWHGHYSALLFARQPTHLSGTTTPRCTPVSRTTTLPARSISSCPSQLSTGSQACLFDEPCCFGAGLCHSAIKLWSGIVFELSRFCFCSRRFQAGEPSRGVWCRLVHRPVWTRVASRYIYQLKRLNETFWFD